MGELVGTNEGETLGPEVEGDFVGKWVGEREGLEVVGEFVGPTVRGESVGVKDG